MWYPKFLFQFFGVVDNMGVGWSQFNYPVKYYLGKIGKCAKHNGVGFVHCLIPPALPLLVYAPMRRAHSQFLVESFHNEDWYLDPWYVRGPRFCANPDGSRLVIP